MRERGVDLGVEAWANWTCEEDPALSSVALNFILFAVSRNPPATQSIVI